MVSPVPNETEVVRAPAAPSVSVLHRTTTHFQRWAVPLLLVLAFVAAVLTRLYALQLPLERDEGAYSTIAALWMQGQLPYRDIFDHKPPLIYVLYMPPLLVGGDPAVAIRVWASLLFLCQLPLVYVLGRVVWTSTTAAFATLVYAVVGSAFRLQGVVFNTEQALMLPALVALWLLMRAIADDRLRWRLGYGLCLGLVSLIKPTVVPFLMPLVLLAGAWHPIVHLRNVGAMVGGMVLPWLPVLAVWGGAGAWSDLVFALVTYNRLYAAESLRTRDGGAVVNVIAPLGALLIYAAGGMTLAGWRTLRSRQRLALALWTLVGIAAAVLSLRGYIHYYYPALPGLALLAAPAVTRLLERRGAGTAVGKRLAAAVLAAVLLVPYVRDAVAVSRLDATQQAARLYGEIGTDYFASASAVAAYIRAVTTPEQTIFVWASEPQLYLLADRRPSSRFIYDYPLALVPAANTQLVTDLRQHPPALVVLYRGSQPPVFVALAEQYGLRFVKQIGGYDIWATSVMER